MKNKTGFKIESIYKSLEEKIGQIHDSLFNSFFVDITSTLTYIEDVFVNNRLTQFLSTADQINKSLKKLNSESCQLISNKSSFPSLKSSSPKQTAQIDAINEAENEVNRLKIDVSCLESRLNQINKQIQSTLEDSSNSSSSLIFTDSSQVRNIIKKADNGDAKASSL